MTTTDYIPLASVAIQFLIFLALIVLICALGNLKGPKGDPGQSVKGDTGEKPIKGVDYFTHEEIEQFKRDVTPIKGVHYFDGKDSRDIVTHGSNHHKVRIYLNGLPYHRALRGSPAHIRASRGEGGLSVAPEDRLPDV